MFIESIISFTYQIDAIYASIAPKELPHRLECFFHIIVHSSILLKMTC